MELQKRLDKVFACKNLFYCSENERKEIKEYLIPAAFEYHFENCSLYKNYCEKIWIDPSKIKKIEYNNNTLIFYANEIPSISLNFKGIQVK